MAAGTEYTNITKQKGDTRSPFLSVRISITSLVPTY